MTTYCIDGFQNTLVWKSVNCKGTGFDPIFLQTNNQRGFPFIVSQHRCALLFSNFSRCLLSQSQSAFEKIEIIEVILT